MLDGDWDTCVAMAKDQVKEGAHVLDVCVDYVGRDGTADMDEIASRFATQASVAAGARLHRARRSSRPACSGSAAGPSSTRPTSRTATPRAPASTGSSRWPASTAPRSICLLHRRGGPGPRRRVEAAGRPPHPRPRRRPLRPRARRPHLRRAHLPALHRRRRPARATPSTPSRPSGASRPSCPACYTTLGLSNVSLRPQPRRPPRPQLGVPARVRAGRPRLGHRPRRARSCRSTEIPDEQREVCLDLIYDRRGPAGGDEPTTTTRCQTLLDVFADVKAAEVEKEDRSDWTDRAAPVSHRIIDGDREGLDRRPRRGPGRRASPPLAIINDVLLAGMKVVGELFGSRRDAAAVRAAVGRDHEGVGRLPRAASWRRSTASRQGPHRARHGQGRRPRHRQEPRRHHPHQQRLRGAQPRHQDRRSPR